MEISEIDFIYSRCCNNASIVTGTISSFFTTYLVARLAESLLVHYTSFGQNKWARGLSFSAAFIVGTGTGHFVTTQVIGLIAKSALGKLGVSLAFNSLGSIAGITLAIVYSHLA